MAQYRAVIQGNRGETSRLGSKASGITTHTDGWNSGVKVVGWFDEIEGVDRFGVFATGGSTGAYSDKYLGDVKVIDGKPVWVPAGEGFGIGL